MAIFLSQHRLSRQGRTHRPGADTRDDIQRVTNRADPPII